MNEWCALEDRYKEALFFMSRGHKTPGRRRRSGLIAGCGVREGRGFPDENSDVQQDLRFGRGEECDWVVGDWGGRGRGGEGKGDGCDV